MASSLSPDLWRLIADQLNDYSQMSRLAWSCRALRTTLGEGYWKTVFRRDISRTLELPNGWVRHDYGLRTSEGAPERFGRPYEAACRYSEFLSANNAWRPVALEGFDRIVDAQIGDHNVAETLLYLAMGGHRALYESYLDRCPDFDLLGELDAYGQGERELRRREDGVLCILEGGKYKTPSSNRCSQLCEYGPRLALYLLKKHPELSLELSELQLDKIPELLPFAHPSRSNLQAALCLLDRLPETEATLDAVWELAERASGNDKLFFSTQALVKAGQLLEGSDTERRTGQLLAKRAYESLGPCIRQLDQS